MIVVVIVVVHGGGCQLVVMLTSNHLEERLLDQAPARASYTLLFGGHSHSTPQGMIFDVQPLVKSLFCPIRPSPIGFLDSEASYPVKLDITFFRGGGGWGAGVKSLCSEVPAQRGLNEGENGQR